MPESEIVIRPSNRAFQYNDGAFETMLFINGEIRFLELHMNRLKRAVEVLKIELPNELSEPETVSEIIKNLITANSLSGNIRIKLKIWRGGEGLYTPIQNHSESLITVALQPETFDLIESADFAQSVRTLLSPYSFFKGPNSVQYVLAGIEKQQRNLEEIILLSSEGFVSECMTSNVFWVKNNIVYTPSLETGCIDGIMREHLLITFLTKGILFQEGKSLPEELLNAEVSFTTNALGIKIIKRIGNKIFNSELPEFLQTIS